MHPRSLLILQGDQFNISVFFLYLCQVYTCTEAYTEQITFYKVHQKNTVMIKRLHILINHFSDMCQTKKPNQNEIIIINNIINIFNHQTNPAFVFVLVSANHVYHQILHNTVEVINIRKQKIRERWLQKFAKFQPIKTAIVMAMIGDLTEQLIPIVPLDKPYVSNIRIHSKITIR